MPLLRFLLVVPVWWWAALAQAQPPDEVKKTDDPVEQCEVRFTDDSVVRMSILQERLEVVTKYGKLSIPVADIVKIDFGLHVPEELEKKFARAIEDLGHENYKIREQAMKSLVSWGPHAYPQVYRASKSDQPDVVKRAQIALDKIKAKHPARNLRLREEDLIVTASFTVIGKITTQTIKAKAENFGDMDLHLAKLRTIRSLGAGQEVQVTVDAGKYALNGQWLDSGFEVRQGMRISVTASGTIDLWPQQGGNFKCGPNGYDQNAGGGFGGKKKGFAHFPGTLVGRIGEAGATFVIGDSYEGAANRDGKLYLQIVQSPWQNQGGSIGSFDVKVATSTRFGD